MRRFAAPNYHSMTRQLQPKRERPSDKPKVLPWLSKVKFARKEYFWPGHIFEAATIAVPLALLPASAPAAAEETSPAVSVSLDPRDVWVENFEQEATFRKQVLTAIELKRQGQALKAFRTLYDQIKIPAGEEDKALGSLGPSSCSEGKNQECLFQNAGVSVAEQPAPADITDLPSLYLRGPAPESKLFHPVVFTWQRLRAEDSRRIAAWNEQAASGLPFTCQAQTRVCHQLFRVSAEDTNSHLRDDAFLHLPDGEIARPSLAICTVQNVGPGFGRDGSAVAPPSSVFGPPKECIAVLAQSKGAAYAVSISARGLWDNLPGVPIRLCCGEDPPPILRVRISGTRELDRNAVPDDWLPKSIAAALSRPPLQLQAVAPGPRVVLATTGVRKSRLLAPLGEWGSFELWLEPDSKRWLVTLEHIDLRVMPEGSSELRHASSDEEARYEKSIRHAIQTYLISACARMRHKCDISE